MSKRFDPDPYRAFQELLQTMLTDFNTSDGYIARVQELVLMIGGKLASCAVMHGLPDSHKAAMAGQAMPDVPDLADKVRMLGFPVRSPVACAVRSKRLRCSRCGSSSHAADNCSHPRAVCFDCKKEGHFRSDCHSKNGFVGPKSAVHSEPHASPHSL
ncbi:hypothetical protein Ciccas_014228 [Cichlidogyrus casuarinus]|uniref:CCHC-type domain-containing protein n=1 Tax=Cichlidogyrus casuarinus TaxID=1844966 RepID=A0ABD2PIN3_9PLAT